MFKVARDGSFMSPQQTFFLITPAAPTKSHLTTSASLNKLLDNGPEPVNIPQHNAIKDISSVDNHPIRRSIEKLLNTEDVSPMILNAALVLGSDEAERIMDDQKPENSGVVDMARNQLMPRNYARAVAC
ncbi:uncharacterized protein VP01_1159g1 [Puccinia sorghi]|uniref:Uncharacterized protein n=1 Tax=Puccinia sorghi TaxID=27349 RepID=A0A0L6VRQ1_9BASI|nr:uncharacterized protein VP01_1159g1 [Puccinia sorghi]